MIATDFIYDGQRLTSLGYMVCQFDESGGFVSSSAGSQLTFYKVSANCGKNYWMAGSQYDEQFEADISICKPDGSEITPVENAALMRWLNRPEYHDLYIGMAPIERTDEYIASREGDFIVTRDGDRLHILEYLQYHYDDIHYRGTFNVDKVEHRGKIIGMTLHFTSDGPFGYGMSRSETFELRANGSYSFEDTSDEVGYLYPDSMQIVCNGSGDLILTNSIENRRTVINNVSAGEVITFDKTVASLTSSMGSHSILDDFNYNFFRIANKYDDRTNTITVSLPCSIKFSYTPRRKVVF